MNSIFEIRSTVISGKHMGKKLGFPTANLSISPNVSLPPNGVYAAEVSLDNSCKKYMAVLNQGFQPTLPSGNISVEVHIINFNQNIYGKQLYVKYLYKLREERLFSSVEELKKQLEKDKAFAISLFEQNKL